MSKHCTCDACWVHDAPPEWCEFRYFWRYWKPPEAGSFSKKAPNITAAVHAALDHFPDVPLTEHGIPKLSIEALYFLWCSTATRHEAQRSNQDDWYSALQGMWAVDWRRTPQSMYGSIDIDRFRARLTYNDDWSTVIAILQRATINEWARYCACYTWIASTGGFDVPEAHRGAFARIFFPPYTGGPLTVYRGCQSDEGHHCSWTTSRDVARRYAHWLRDSSARILCAEAPADAIIWDASKAIPTHLEVVVDPSRLRNLRVVERIPHDAQRSPDSPPYSLGDEFLSWGQSAWDECQRAWKSERRSQTGRRSHSRRAA